MMRVGKSSGTRNWRVRYMKVVPEEELEKVWRELEIEIRKVSPLSKELRSYTIANLVAIADYRKVIAEAYGEMERMHREFVPKAPSDIWHRVVIMARNLGQPVSIVLGDLIIKALSKDPPELARYRLSFCEKMLSEGKELLRKGDLTQASEKFWNAVVQAIKAVAAKEGLELKTHADLWSYVNRLAKTRGDLRIAGLFADANYLHRNFYEGNLLPELMREYIESAKKLIQKLRKFVEA